MPIEVKAGPAGRLRSLHLLLGQYPGAAPGVVLSEAGFSVLAEQRLAFLPLYFAAGAAGKGLDAAIAAAGMPDRPRS